MNDNQLTALFQRIHQDHFPRRRRKIEARFYPYRSLRHTIEWNPWRIKIKVSQYFHTAPRHILEYVAVILLSKIYKLPVDRELRREYRIFLDELAGQIPRQTPKQPAGYSPMGKTFDLQGMFEQLNVLYFDDKLKQPLLGWSKNRSYTRLGFYDAQRNLLVISRIFDDSRVPEQIIRYLLYHEMLHIFFPTTTRNGRRTIHSPAFKSAEKKFPAFDDIQKWIKKNLKKFI